MKELITMFSTPPLGVFEYDGDLEEVKDAALKEKYVLYENRGNPILQSLDTYSFNLPVFKKIKQFCSDSVHQYQEEVIGSEHPLEMQQSWINLYNKNVSLSSHYHSNSFLSGIFFLTKGSPIAFFSDVHKTNYTMETYCPDPNRYLPSTNRSFTYPPRPGLLLVFSSQTPHAVLNQESEEQRISVSFNMFPKLPYGDFRRFTRLGEPQAP